MPENSLFMQVGAGADMGDLQSESKEATDSLLAMGSAAKTAGVALGALAAGGLALATSEALKLQEQAAELRKLLGEDMARTMTDSILDMAGEMPVARRELFAITEQAARLGIRGSQNLEDFTRNVAILASATNVSADEAANSIAKIARVTQTPITEIRGLSAAVNELSNRYGTSAREIIKATGKLAPTLSQIGLAAPEILGIAAAMNEVNISVRRGATRLRRFFQESMNPDKWAPIADAIGMTREQFRVLMSDAEGAQKIFSRVVGTFAEGGEEADALRRALSSASRQGVGALAQNLPRLESAMEDARDSFERGTSAVIEDMKKSQTAGQQWGQVWDRIKSQATGFGTGLVQVVTEIGEYNNLVAEASEITEKFQGEQSELADVAAELRGQVERQINSFGILAGRGGEEALTILQEFRFQMNQIPDSARGAFADEVIPLIEDTSISAERLINIMARLSEFMQTARMPIMDQLTQQALNVIPQLEGSLSNLTGQTNTLSEASTNLIKRLQKERAELRGGRIAAIKTTEAWKTATDAQRDRIRSILDEIQALERLEGAREAARKAMERGLEAGGLLPPTFGLERQSEFFGEQLQQRIRRGTDRILQSMEKVPEVAETAATSVTEFFKVPERFQGMTVKDVQNRIAVMQELQRARERLDLSTMQAQMDLIMDTAGDMADTMVTAFNALFDETKDAEEALRNFFTTLADNLARRAIQSFLFSLIEGAFTRGGGNLFGLGGGTGNAGLGGGIGSLGPNREHGGSVSPGSVYPVGESGVELFVPSVAGEIVPNDKIGGQNVTVQVSQNFNLSAIDERGMSEMIQRNKGMIAQATIDAVKRSERASKALNTRRRR